MRRISTNNKAVHPENWDHCFVVCNSKEQKKPAQLVIIFTNVLLHLLEPSNFVDIYSEFVDISREIVEI
ncbi:hypothetical protein V3595_27430 [Bacillus sp. CFBP9009]